MSKFLTLTLVLLSSLLAHSQAPQELAGILNVRYDGVQIRRANTEAWLPLGSGAVMPFGSGDSVRTDTTGRVSIRFAGGEVLVLPETEFTLTRYAPQETLGQVEWQASLIGVMVQRWNTHPLPYSLQMTDGTLIQAGEVSAVWSLPEQSDTIALHIGEGTAVIGQENLRIPAASTAWLDPAAPRIVALDYPLNAARLEAELLGCEAVIDTVGEIGVLVRRGIGRFNERLGLIPHGAIVNAMAINASGYWVRIQYRAGFSWIVEDAVTMNCPDLPRVSDQTPPERISSVINPSEAEIALLEPFFQTPLQDTFFYQYRN
jgi:hypothetical protein